MDGCLVAVLEVLDVFLDVARGVHGEDIPVAGIVVKGIAVHVVRWLFAGEEKYGAGLGVGVVRFGYKKLVSGDTA